MINPLRCPIVLIAILASMVGYVHIYHRSHVPRRDQEQTQAEKIVLRMPEDRLRSSVDPAARESTRPVVREPKYIPRTLPLKQPPVDDQHPPSNELAKSNAVAQSEYSSKLRFGTGRRPVRGPQTPKAYSRRPASNKSNSADTVHHRLVDGDTLRRLANRYLGDENRYMEIFHANRNVLVQPELLPLGERLVIPVRKGSSDGSLP